MQLVVLDQASPDLVHRVLRDGVLLLERDRSRRIDFEVRSRAEYFDLEPLRRLYREERFVEHTSRSPSSRRWMRHPTSSRTTGWASRRPTARSSPCPE